jgi:hypothetical protein
MSQNNQAVNIQQKYQFEQDNRCSYTNVFHNIGHSIPVFLDISPPVPLLLFQSHYHLFHYSMLSPPGFRGLPLRALQLTRRSPAVHPSSFEYQSTGRDVFFQPPNTTYDEILKLIFELYMQHLKTCKMLFKFSSWLGVALTR